MEPLKVPKHSYRFHYGGHTAGHRCYNINSAGRHFIWWVLQCSLDCKANRSGFSVLMFVGTMWALTHKRRMQEINRPIVAVAILLLLLSTSVSLSPPTFDIILISIEHIIVDIVRVEEGLVRYRDTFPGGPPAFFADVAQVTFVIKNAIYVMQTLLGDGVVVSSVFVNQLTIRLDCMTVFLAKDISLLRRLAICVDHNLPKRALVRCRRSGFDHTQGTVWSNVTSK